MKILGGLKPVLRDPNYTNTVYKIRETVVFLSGYRHVCAHVVFDITLVHRNINCNNVSSRFIVLFRRRHKKIPTIYMGPLTVQ